MSSPTEHRSPYLACPVPVAFAYVEGRETGQSLIASEASCPYCGGSQEGEAWLRGFRYGRTIRDEAWQAWGTLRQSGGPSSGAHN